MRVEHERGAMPSRDEEALVRVTSLAETSRRRLYEFVVSRHEPVSRDEAAAACRIERATAAYHLDRLVDSGLLAASFSRPEGRSGPGAGRPAKRYARVDTDVALTLPPRDYQLAAEILTRAVEADQTGAIVATLHDAAARMGAELAATGPDADDLVSLLREHGFEPYLDDGVLRLRNCPFHHLAQQHTELICGMNRALLAAIAADVEPDTDVRLDPAPQRCCVAFHR